MVKYIPSKTLKTLLKNGRCTIKTPEEKPGLITHFYLNGDMMIFVADSFDLQSQESINQHAQKVNNFCKNLLKQFNTFKWTTIFIFSFLGTLPVFVSNINISQKIMGFSLISVGIYILRKFFMNLVVNVLSIKNSNKTKTVLKRVK